ncbi:cytochrome c oxidase subunit IV [Homoserinimonas aerilata]|uniref:Cytochrome c oxidase polypeptide 4 n=1 Tax=Homoserinimonas aerilata TaxID=1162970 RepID=A0A542YJB0_9MICO|nr:cytochrome c oxidase subunit 4 [Homoserinimonas aerilata]TQL48131.1 cytochrome c oxidase subunit IV [Homoserinimonas aerilata]
MKTSANIFWTIAVFFFVVSAMYTVWSLLDFHHGTVEWAGTLALALCGILSGFIAFYVGKSYSSQGGELPEDRLDANIDDGDPELGHFSPWSWWPILLAGGGSLVVMGIGVGVWISFIGAALLLVSLVGWVYEYYRGNFGH